MLARSDVAVSLNYDYSPAGRLNKVADSHGNATNYQVFIGIEDEGGLERFDVTVCTPKWIFKNMNENDHMIGHGLLIAPKIAMLV